MTDPYGGNRDDGQRENMNDAGENSLGDSLDFKQEESAAEPQVWPSFDLEEVSDSAEVSEKISSADSTEENSDPWQQLSTMDFSMGGEQTQSPGLQNTYSNAQQPNFGIYAPRSSADLPHPDPINPQMSNADTQATDLPFSNENSQPEAPTSVPYVEPYATASEPVQPQQQQSYTSPPPQEQPYVQPEQLLQQQMYSGQSQFVQQPPTQQYAGQQYYPQMMQYGQPPTMMQQYSAQPYPAIQKTWIAALLLSFFLGFFGAHNFYLGYTGRGLGQLLLFAFNLFLAPFLLIIPFLGIAIVVLLWMVLVIWAIVDFVLVLAGGGGYDHDSKGIPLAK